MFLLTLKQTANHIRIPMETERKLDYANRSEDVF